MKGNVTRKASGLFCFPLVKVSNNLPIKTVVRGNNFATQMKCCYVQIPSFFTLL